MQRVSKDELLSPNVCIVCEERPDGDAVDTLRQGNFGGASPFNGRKYVCWRCVEVFAKLFNFEKGEDVEQAKADAEFASRSVEVIKERVKEFAEKLVEFADHGGNASEEAEFSISRSKVPEAVPVKVESVPVASEEEKPVKKAAPKKTATAKADSEDK